MTLGLLALGLANVVTRASSEVVEDGVLGGVRTALAWFDDRAAWAHLVRNAMTADFSWPKRVPQYEELYRSLL